MHASAVRPIAALPGNLALVLRQGQVLAGEVLQTFAGGSLLIGIGRHRVPARSQAELAPGRRFLFRVEEEAGEITLRVLSQEEPGEPSLARALRTARGWERPLGEALAELLRLAADEDPAQPPALRKLAAQAAEHALEARTDGGGVRARLERSGFFHEPRLLRLVLAEGRLSPEAKALAETVAQQAPDSADAPLAILARLFSRGAAGGERPRAAPGAQQELAQTLQQDFKSQLLTALAELPEGAPREAVLRTLAALELEQLLNVARALEGEPAQWSLLLQDGNATGVLQLRHEPVADSATPGREGERAHRLSLCLAFQHTGPVRVDLALHTQSLAARVRVGNERVAAVLRPLLPGLEQALSRGGRPASVALSVEEPERLRFEPPGDLGWLRERSLLDRLG